MRIYSAFPAAAGLLFVFAVPSACALAAATPPDCKPPLVPKTSTENGQLVVHCVNPQSASAAEQFRSFILGNQFRRGKRSYTFCKANRYMANKSRGRFSVTHAKLMKREGGRVTITATIVLKNSKGKKSTLKGVLATTGLKLNGDMFGFGGPAPDC